MIRLFILYQIPKNIIYYQIYIPSNFDSYFQSLYLAIEEFLLLSLLKNY